MKGFQILLACCFALLSVVSNAQKITLKTDKARLADIFLQIEKQSGFFFTYTNETLAGTSPVTVDFKDLILSQALDACLAGQPLTYEIIGVSVVIRRKPNSPPPPTTTLIPVLKGKVLDQGDDMPLYGATIQLRGSSIGDISGNDGGFTLYDVNPNAVLDVSFIGFIGRGYRIPAGVTNVVIRLERDTPSLAVTIVNTGLYKRPIGNFTGASHAVSGAELKATNPVNLFSALATLDPSLRITQNNLLGNDPNALPVIQLRGQNNLPLTTQGGTNNALATPVSSGDIMAGYLANPNEPLLILDGFQTTIQAIYDLDINRIDKVTVLKDAAATVAYGSRAANGVIVIETKKPTDNRLELGYSFNLGIQSPDLSSYNLMDAAELLEAQRIAGVYTDAASHSDDLALKQWYDYRLYQAKSGVNTDWLWQPVQNGVGTGHNLYLSGGNKSLRFNMVGTLNQTNGVMKGSDRNVASLSVWLGYTARKIRFNNNSFVSSTRSNNSKWGDFNSYARTFPYFKAYDSAGQLLKVLEPSASETGIAIAAPGGIMANPMNDASLKSRDYAGYLLFTNTTQLEWSIRNNLKLSGNLHFYNQLPEAIVFLPAAHSSFAQGFGNPVTTGSYTETTGRNTMLEGRLSLDYSKRKGDHTLYASAGSSLQTTSSEATSVTVTGIPSDNLAELGLANGYSPGTVPFSGRNATHSFTSFFSASYNYKNLLTLEGTGNVSGSSQFGANNRLAPFGAFGGGWNLHQTSWLQPVKFIRQLRLLATYGATGNQNFAAYMAQPIYQYNTLSNYRLQAGASMQAYANPDLKWQQTQKFNLGLTADMWEGLLSFRFDYYIEHTNNLILPIAIAPSTGFITYQDNLGSTQNKGYELMLSVSPIRNKEKDMNWTIYGNAGHYKNVIKTLSPAVEKLNEANNGSGADQHIPQPRFEVGQSMTRIWAVRSLGIDPATGNELYLKRDGSVSFIWDPTDKVAVGDATSAIKGTLGSLFSYRGLSVAFNLGFEAGGEFYNQTLADKVENVDLRYSNADRRVLYDRWHQPGDKASFKALQLNGAATYATSRFVQANNYLDLNSLTIGYNFPTQANWMEHTRLRSARVYFTGNNFYRWSSVPAERGTLYPFARTYSIGLNISF